MYGRQPRWKKYAKRLLQRSPDARFEEVIDKLNELTQQAWSLQTNVNPGAAFSRCGFSHLPEDLLMSVPMSLCWPLVSLSVNAWVLAFKGL